MSSAKNTLLVALGNLIDKVKEAEAEKKHLQSELITAMEGEGFDTLVVTDGDTEYRGTIVRGTTTSFDEETLKTLVPEEVWQKITRTVVDSKALEAAVAQGDISPATLAQASESFDRSPYVRVTTKRVKTQTVKKLAKPKTKPSIKKLR